MTNQRGFSLAELMIAMAIMLLISGAATTALLKMTSAQATVWNRTQMHSGIRGATEVLQQEVGQAGRVALPTVVTLGGDVAVGSATVAVSPASSASAMFAGEYLTVDAGTSQETVQLTDVSTSPAQITAVFANPHLNGAAVAVLGSFQAGVVPPSVTNGSTGTVLKLFGDINGDGNMVYIEYTCDTTAHNLYRNSMAWNAGAKSAPAASQILLTNIAANPGNTACFTYQTTTVSGTDYVTDVAITLTVQTQQVDPVTKAYQTETKALLNVSPRNVFNAWMNESIGNRERVQPIPPSITALLP